MGCRESTADIPIAKAAGGGLILLRIARRARLRPLPGAPSPVRASVRAADSARRGPDLSAHDSANAHDRADLLSAGVRAALDERVAPAPRLEPDAGGRHQ